MHFVFYRKNLLKKPLHALLFPHFGRVSSFQSTTTTTTTTTNRPEEMQKVRSTISAATLDTNIINRTQVPAPMAPGGCALWSSHIACEQNHIDISRSEHFNPNIYTCKGQHCIPMILPRTAPDSAEISRISWWIQFCFFWNISRLAGAAGREYRQTDR